MAGAYLMLFWPLTFSGVNAQGLTHSHPALPLGYPCSAVPDQKLMPLESHCFPNKTCTEKDKFSRYSKIDGLCNNLKNPTQGASGTDFFHLVEKRFIRPPGADMKFYLEENGRPLPNARSVSTAVHGHVEDDLPASENSLLVMQFGQLLDHDLTLTAEADLCHKKCGEKPIACCDYFLGLNNYTAEQRPVECWPIPIPADDPVFKGPNAPKCLEFKRSQKSACRSERFGGRSYELFNEVTHYLDASSVYGSNPGSLEILRQGLHGALDGQNDREAFMLPDEVQRCAEDHKGAFIAGDVRVNENPGLAAMHTLFAREHNRLAGQIKAMARHKNDESIMYEARRYVIAQMQNIAYKEFLPSVLPSDAIQRYDLRVDEDSTYDESVQAVIFVEFSTAAFRFGHTLVSSLIQLYRNYTEERLDEHFFNTDPIRNSPKMGELFYNMATRKAHRIDSAITDALRNRLFRDLDKPFGSDLASLNIHRGRDHRMGSYNQVRIECGLKALPDTFAVEAERPKEFSAVAWARLRSVYEIPGLIELFPGGLSETPQEPGKLGPVFSCIIGRQFRNLKLGDRYFFTHQNNVHEEAKFCRSDLELLKKRTMRDIICDNTDVSELPRSAFRANEPIVSCNEGRAKLEPQDLCLFGASLQARDLKPPGFLPQSKASDLALVIGGGFNGSSILDSVEAYSPDGRCNFLLPNLPLPIYGGALFFMNEKLYSCGGSPGLSGSLCYVLSKDSQNKWESQSGLTLNQPRIMGASTINSDGVVYFSGGYGANSSIEYLDQFRKTWNIVEGIEGIRHCLVALDQGKLVLIGGYGKGNKVAMFDPILEKWQALPDINVYSDRHSCALLPKREGNDHDRILVVSQLYNAFIYDVQSGKTTAAGPPYFKRGFASLKSIGNRIYAIGGDFNTDIVEVFNENSLSFETISPKLIVGRSRFAITAVTKSFLRQLGYTSCLN